MYLYTYSNTVYIYIYLLYYIILYYIILYYIILYYIILYYIILYYIILYYIILYYIIYQQYGYFLKWWYLQSTPQKWSFLVGKPIVAGETHHFSKPPISLKLELLRVPVFQRFSEPPKSSLRSQWRHQLRLGESVMAWPRTRGRRSGHSTDLLPSRVSLVSLVSLIEVGIPPNLPKHWFLPIKL